jgi:hypothetical protein
LKSLIGSSVVLLLCVSSSLAWENKSLLRMINDKIQVEINDYEYPYDQISYDKDLGPDPVEDRTWVSNLVDFKIAFWDGSGETYEYNTTKRPNEFAALVEVVDWTYGASDPENTKLAHVVLGDHATTPRFTIELTITMQGANTNSIRSDFVITRMPGETTLTGAKLYLSGDPNVNGSLASDRSAYYAARDLFYVYDNSKSPALYFGCNTSSADQSRFPMHYHGHHWEVPYGTLTMRTQMDAGANYLDIVNSTLGDQVAGWNWDLGNITGTVRFSVFIGLGLSVEDLAIEVTPVFLNDFESGDTTLWSTTTP